MRQKPRRAAIVAQARVGTKRLAVPRGRLPGLSTNWLKNVVHNTKKYLRDTLAWLSCAGLGSSPELRPDGGAVSARHGAGARLT
jgi:hypothetical protein